MRADVVRTERRLTLAGRYFISAMRGLVLGTLLLGLTLMGCAQVGSSARSRTAAIDGQYAGDWSGANDEPPVQSFAEIIYQAAISGDAVAQRRLGLMHAAGSGVPTNLAAAVDWLHRAAEQGDCAAQQHLGLMFLGRGGFPYDIERASHWLRLAADHPGDCTS